MKQKCLCKDLVF